MSDFDVSREDGASGGRYVAIVDGHEAEMTYSRAGTNRIIIDHTGVPDALRGRGVGLVLVEAAVKDARAEGFKIIPLCPFAKATLEKHPEWADVVQ
ncbi:MAG: GNAT family N-acetyltransferase [Pseudomonadota bacterium]